MRKIMNIFMAIFFTVGTWICYFNSNDTPNVSNIIIALIFNIVLVYGSLKVSNIKLPVGERKASGFTISIHDVFRKQTCPYCGAKMKKKWKKKLDIDMSLRSKRSNINKLYPVFYCTNCEINPN